MVGTTIKTKLDGKPVSSLADSTFTKSYMGFRTDACCGERGTAYDAVVTGTDGSTLLDTDFASGRNPFTGGEIVDSALVVSGTTDALYGPATRPLPLLRKDFATESGKKIPDAAVALRGHAAATGTTRHAVARPRVSDDLGSYLAHPLAQFTAGPAVLFLGLRATLYAAAALILLATLVMVVTPSIRALAPRTAEPLPAPASEDPVPG